jgi:hypothetical protein
MPIITEGGQFTKGVATGRPRSCRRDTHGAYTDDLSWARLLSDCELVRGVNNATACGAAMASVTAPPTGSARLVEGRRHVLAPGKGVGPGAPLFGWYGNIA